MSIEVDRRAVLVGGAAALAVPIVAAVGSSVLPTGVVSTNVGPPPPSQALGAYLKIDTADTVTVVIGSTEMGQGIMTGLAQLVAEELMLSWSQVRVEHNVVTSASPNPYANPLFGAQLTGGSTSMRGWYLPLRTAAAIARDLLFAAAETKTPGGGWSLVAGGKVTNGRQTTYLFSDLVAVAATLPQPTTATLAATKTVIGQRMARTDIPAKVDGSAVFGMDVQVPGMVFASVVHCPTLGGTVKTMPSSASNAIALVNLGNAVGVVASDTWTAMRIASSLSSKITWTLPATTASRDSASILATGNDLLNSTTVAPRVYETTGGDPEAALAAAKVTIDATYQLPYLAHATMEVMNCTAVVTATSAEIWAPTQGQALCIPTVTSITGLPASAVKVHTTFLGGGYGRKIEQDYIGQAVKIAKAVNRPVKLIWSRTQDFQNDKYRPCASIRVRAGLDSANAFTSLIYRNVSPSINIQRNTQPGNNPEDTGAVAGAVGLPYAIANRRIEFVPNPADIPLGYWRSVGESYNTFAVESAVDELALAAGVDPMAFRKGLAAGDARALGVLSAVEALSNWGAPTPAGSANGLAFLKGFGSYIAIVAQVSKSSVTTKAGTTLVIPRVSKVFCAIDCGIAINPDSIEAQMQGGVAHGLSAAMWGQVLFKAGVPQVSNFNQYRLVKLADMPTVSVKIIDSNAAPGGVGETGVPCVAPAVANAFAKLTGNRVRSLPFYPGATMEDL